jgi:acyl-coenzyme A thioesterase PaaI-like protein
METESKSMPDPDGTKTFINDLDFHCDVVEDGPGMEGELVVSPYVLAPGSRVVRPAILATMADVIAGLPANAATAPRLPLTLDIDVRTLAPAGERLWAKSRILKVGRNTVATEVDFTNGRSGPLVAVSYLTFMPSPRPQDVAPVTMAGMHTTGSLDEPIAEHVGAREVSPGVVEIEHGPFLQQASGALQGGIVALLGELAAESLARRPVLDLDTRYLTTVRFGPARATAVAAGDDHVRVEVRDTGNGDRLAARIMARVDPKGGR